MKSELGTREAQRERLPTVLPLFAFVMVRRRDALRMRNAPNLMTLNRMAS
jgi:hypothetical protein